MGGSHGLKMVNYERSSPIRQKVWDEVKNAHTGLVITECGDCGLQIEAGTGVAIKHPMVVLNQAYNAFDNHGAA
ncbi:MAG: hypothetical protein HY742_07555 [Deltaproteobacteria bacterium]|nr:hypothetical protein [Deltaproteobacteria bacterium]